jgi:C4-type Zn-finger protein
MLLKGCQEGKMTPRLTEVKCPRCGEWVDVFVKLGGMPGQTGTLVSSESCGCGYVFRAGTYESDYEG